MRALVVGLFVGAVAALGCGSKSGPPLTPQCLHTSDCKSFQVCSLGYCVKECNTSADCTQAGQRCIKATKTDADGGVVTGTVCQAPELSSCTYTSQCKDPLVCSIIDGQCRSGCQTEVDCAKNQVCTADTHLCADPRVDTNYDPATMTLKETAGRVKVDASMGDAGGASGSGGSGGSAGSAGSGGAGGASDASVDGDAATEAGAGGTGGTPNLCVNAQTTFGNIAQGDTDPHFNTGVATKSGNVLYIFDSYIGPDPTPADGGATDGGADAAVPSPNQNWIYAQAFDSVTGDKLGSAAPLLHATDGATFGLGDVAVAPTGEIALLYYRGTPIDGAVQALFAVFLRPSATGDGGASTPGLTVVKTVQLESLVLGAPWATWSSASQAFIFSWKYHSTSWFARVRRFTTSGVPAGGDTSVVATPDGTVDNTGYTECQVGTSGMYLGVGCRQPGDGRVYLSVLDQDGLLYGPEVPMSNLSSQNWIASGGTTQGFVTLSNGGNNASGVFVPLAGMQSVTNDAGPPPSDAGAPGDGGADAAPPRFLQKTFAFPTTATYAKMVSDDSSAGGVGVALNETGGASFVYINADASKQFNVGTILSSAVGLQISITNQKGTFTVGLYEGGTKHATQAVVSGCSR